MAFCENRSREPKTRTDIHQYPAFTAAPLKPSAMVPDPFMAALGESGVSNPSSVWRNSIAWNLSSQIHDESDFVAFGKLGAMEAVRPDLLRENILVHHSKSHTLEKTGFVSERKETVDSQLTSLRNARFHQKPPQPPSLVFVGNRQRPDFSQILPHDVEAAAPHHLTGGRILDHKHVAKVGVELAQRACQQQALLGKTGQELLDGDHIAGPGFPNFMAF